MQLRKFENWYMEVEASIFSKLGGTFNLQEEGRRLGEHPIEGHGDSLK